MTAFCLECRTNVAELKPLKTSNARVTRYCCEACHKRIMTARKKAKKIRK